LELREILRSNLRWLSIRATNLVYHLTLRQYHRRRRGKSLINGLKKPSHFSSSTIIKLPFLDCLKASRGQALTHGGSSQNLQVMAVLNRGVRRMTLILDNMGFGKPFFSNEQAYSHNPHPVHLSELIDTNLLLLISEAFTSPIILYHHRATCSFYYLNTLNKCRSFLKIFFKSFINRDNISSLTFE